VSGSPNRKQGRKRFLAVPRSDLHADGMKQNGWLLLALLSGCAGPPPRPASAMLADALAGTQTRLTIAGDRVVSVVTPVDVRALPAAARAACEAEAAGVEVLFCGRERGPRGRGYRVEQRVSGPDQHERAVLVTEDGRVLERRRTVPLARAPRDVVAAALSYGAFVERVELVAEPGRDERWAVVVRDRAGSVFAVDIELDGRLRRALRRTTARVDS